MLYYSSSKNTVCIAHVFTLTSVKYKKINFANKHSWFKKLEQDDGGAPNLITNPGGLTAVKTAVVFPRVSSIGGSTVIAF